VPYGAIMLHIQNEGLNALSGIQDNVIFMRHNAMQILLQTLNCVDIGSNARKVGCENTKQKRHLTKFMLEKESAQKTKIQNLCVYRYVVVKWTSMRRITLGRQVRMLVSAMIVIIRRALSWTTSF